jgi:hypothetical protein
MLSVIGTPLRRVVEKLFVAQMVRHLLFFLCGTIGFITMLTIAPLSHVCVLQPQTLYVKTLSNIPHVFIARSPGRFFSLQLCVQKFFLWCLLHVLPLPTFPFLIILLKFSEWYKFIQRLGPKTIHRLRLEYTELDVHKFQSPPFRDTTCRPMYVLSIACVEEMRNTVLFCVMQFCCVGCAPRGLFPWRKNIFILVTTFRPVLGTYPLPVTRGASDSDRLNIFKNNSGYAWGYGGSGH